MKKREWMLRLSALLLVLLMMLGAVSCGGDAEEPKTPDEPAADEPSDEPAQSGDKDEDENKESATLESERDYEVVAGTALHPELDGLTEVVNRYMTQAGSISLDGAITTFQYGGVYRGSVALPTDAVMVYIWKPEQAETLLPSWSEQSDEYSLHMMTIMNRAGSDWLERDDDYMDTIQKDKNGNYSVHSGTGDSTVYYLVPTEEWIEYVWEIVVTAMELAPMDVIVFEEPDMWQNTGYSKAFKQEWEDYYGEPWEDQTSSPEAMYKSARLKVYLIDRLMTEISDRMAIEYPDTKLYLASHSTNSYNSVRIVSGLNQYVNSGIYDGLIGQTWTDTVGVGLMQNGKEIYDGYMMAAIEYASYVGTAGDGMLYALADPVGDGITKGREESEYYDRYFDTIVAQLMQPAINRFEVMPWPNRCFENGSRDYRAVQLNVIAAVTEASGKEATVSAGTPGITYLISDSHAWQTSPNGAWSRDSESGLLGVTLPLVTDGIPLKVGAMEMIEDASDLADVNLLLLSFDCQKPLDEQLCRAVADWILDGGVCLYVGGHDRFEESEYEWWAEYGSPLQALLDMLETDISVNMPEISQSTEIVWSPDGSSIGELGSTYDTFVASFVGEGEKLLTLGDSKGAEVVGLDRAVGKGRIILSGLPSAMYAETKTGTEQMRRLVAYACQYTEYEYSATTLLWTKRGNVVAAHSIGESNTLGGKFINLFDSELTLSDGYTLKANESALLYDVTDLDVSAMPRLAFSSGTLVGCEETAERTVYEVFSPTGVYFSSLLMASEGMYPQSVTVQKREGGAEVSYTYGWNNETSTLVVHSRGDAENPVVITVVWASTPVADTEPEYPTYSEFEPVGQDYRSMFAGWESMTYMLNRDTPHAADEFVVVDTSNANHVIKYCDKGREIIYRFDLKQYPHLAAVMFLEQNYLVQVSTDGETWTTIQNFELVNGFRDYGAHKATLVVASDKYAKGADAMYVRLANSDVTQGHGGSISQLTIYYSEAGQTGGDEQPFDTSEPNYLPTDVTAAEWASRYADYRSFKIETNATTESAWRPFIISSPAASDAGWIHKTRCIYTDTKRQIVFGFNLKTYPEAVVLMHVDQNYILEVSPNGSDWLIVQDYSAFHDTRAEYKEGEAYIAISSELLPSNATYMYIRLRNTDITKGNGGALMDFTVFHKGDADAPVVEDKPVEPQAGHVATDVTAEQWADQYAECKSLTVLTNTDTENEWGPFAVTLPTRAPEGWRNARCLFTDAGEKLVLAFDLTKYKDATVVLNISQNYIIEVSTDGKNWTVAQNYADYHAVRAGYKEGAAYIGIEAERFAAGANTMYIRLRNTDSKQGYGAAITDFTIYYK